MAKRVALTALLPATSAALETKTPAPDAPLESAHNRDSRPVSAPTEQTPQQQSPRKVARPAPSKAPGHQHYSQLIRKEARLRDDQIDSLASHARRLSRAKHDSNERITDNTLIRVAVDLLLSDPSLLKGNTEAELRNSVGL